MGHQIHRVSIGMPVYNGENFLEQALDSLLTQTYSDFELVISDNASTDKTQEICRDYALADERIHYYRNNENIGAAPNFYHAFELSSGQYFKWAAHDDLHAPEFLERCVGVLEEDPSIVLCCTKTKFIDEKGEFQRNFDLDLDTNSPKPHKRLYTMINVDHWAFPMFGVVRTDALMSTRRYRNYYGWDRNMLAEVSLLGKIHQISEYLFYRRNHSLASTSLSANSEQLLVSYLKSSPTRFLRLRKFIEYAGAVRRAPLDSAERLLCYLQLVRLAGEKSANHLVRYGKHLGNSASRRWNDPVG